MKNKYLEKLEFNKIKEILSIYAVTFFGKNKALLLEPIRNKVEIEKSLEQTTEATTLILRKGNLPISEIADIRPYIKILRSSNFLNARQLLDIVNILKLSSDLKNYFLSEEIDMNGFINLKPLFQNLYVNLNLQKRIFDSILNENTISDDASPKLKSIRKNIKNKEDEIKDKLSLLINKKFVQESIVTIRNDRYVIPVKSECRMRIKGFAHDVSSSGATLFIEPLSVFELNNEINNLKFEENLEIQKILKDLSAMFLEITDKLENDLNLIGMIDFIFAKAKYSIFLDASKPNINEAKEIKLLDCFHPLLNKDVAVRNDIYLGERFNSLIITGPNTGGKTVILKTVRITHINGYVWIAYSS